MNLTDTTHTAKLVTSTGADVKVDAAWVDHTDGSTYAPGDAATSITTATTTTIVAAPASGVRRQVKRVRVTNVDTTSQTVTLQKDVSGTGYPATPAVALAPGWTLHWTDAGGVAVEDAAGRPVIDTVRFAPRPAVRMPATFFRPSTATNRVTGSGALCLTRMGRATRAISGVKIRYSIVSAFTGATWAESGLYVGDATVGYGAVLRCVGYTDISAYSGDTGAKSTDITASLPVAAGEWLWVGVGVTSSINLKAYPGETLSIVSSVLITTRPSTDLSSQRLRFADIDGVSTSPQVYGLQEVY